MYSWYFDNWGLATPGETVSLRVRQFLEIVNISTAGVFFIMQTNQSRGHTPTAFFTELSQGSHTLGHHPPALITPELGSRQLGTVLMPQILLKLFSLAYQDLPVPSYRHYNEDSCPHFSLAPSASWLILTLPSMALCGMAVLSYWDM